MNAPYLPSQPAAIRFDMDLPESAETVRRMVREHLQALAAELLADADESTSAAGSDGPRADAERDVAALLRLVAQKLT